MKRTAASFKSRIMFPPCSREFIRRLRPGRPDRPRCLWRRSVGRRHRDARRDDPIIDDDTNPIPSRQFGAAIPGANFVDGDDGFEMCGSRAISRLIVDGWNWCRIDRLVTLDMAARTLCVVSSSTATTRPIPTLQRISSASASVPGDNPRFQRHIVGRCWR